MSKTVFTARSGLGVFTARPSLRAIPRLSRVLGLVAFVSLGASATGCIEDADCGVCDPDNLVLESISGLNYASKKVHLLTEGVSKSSYFITEVGPCQDTEEARLSPNPSEFCKLSPLISQGGIEFVFNNLLDPESIELARKQPSNPQLYEIYDWKPEIISMYGPISRYNGDYYRGATEQPDTMGRFVNLSCAGQTEGFTHESYQDPVTNPCNRIVEREIDGESVPLPAKLEPNVEIKSYRGGWTAYSSSCSPPQDGPDTCCTACDWLLSTRVARYGIEQEPPVTGWNVGLGGELSPNAETARVCADPLPTGFVPDKFQTCRNFIVGIDRTEEESQWFYRWNCPGNASDEELRERNDPCFVHKIAFFDKLRETHPDERPTPDDVQARRYHASEKLTAKCTATSQCESEHGLPSTECIGTRFTCSDVDDPSTCTPVSEGSRSCFVDATRTVEEGETAGEACGTAVDGEFEAYGYCRPQWFVTCRADATTTGGNVAYCVDRRFSQVGTAACKRATANFDALCVQADAGDDPTCAGTVRVRSGGRESEKTQRIAYCDGDGNGSISAAECCQESLGGPTAACDPFYQENVVSLSMYERDSNLPDATRRCRCRPLEDLEDAELATCRYAITTGCYADGGRGEFLEDRRGEYAVKFVSGVGGVVYEPALKGVEWRIADLGGIPRASIENCAERAPDRQVGALNRNDGWRANDSTGFEAVEDFDRSLCSGQRYTVVFSVPGNEEGKPYLRDKAGNTLAGKAEYTFETPHFHVVPDSGFPTDNLRVGACGDFTINFSNKYDLSPENLRKLQIFRVTPKTDNQPSELTTPNDACDRVVPVAGGPGCYDDGDALAASNDPCAAPCLTVNVSDQRIGKVGVEIDPREFQSSEGGGSYLQNGETYRLVVPTAASYEQAVGNPAIYQAAFWDACGMPLVQVAGDAKPYAYDFTIDPPKCNEDEDRDLVSLSCDNAKEVFNPDQKDTDGDGFGDVIDLCPFNVDRLNSEDSDRDGVGNRCDSCRQVASRYNANAATAGVPFPLQVRNIPFQQDTDEDGIGDVCDNCPLVANCGDYSLANPYELGDALPDDDASICQRDDNLDMIGDACAGDRAETAAGPIGFAENDDFDQDGIINRRDACPRQPLVLADRIPCETNDECPTYRTCELDTEGANGVCNHVDTDNDGVGDICDTCPTNKNGEQAFDLMSQDEDDEDGDFVGRSCEANVRCSDTERNPRPFGFFPVAASGYCCTVALIEDNAGGLLNALTRTPITAPHPEDPNITIPVRRASNCSEEDVRDSVCARLPIAVETTPGMLVPPEGCEEAFATNEDGIDSPIANIENAYDEFSFDSFDELWGHLCFLPQRDQDFDGLGDPCDLCQHDFDPENLPFVDANGRLWPSDGKYCNGEYNINNRTCGEEPVVDTDTEGTGGSGGASGEDTIG